jgi:hypothetical protein
MTGIDHAARDRLPNPSGSPLTNDAFATALGHAAADGQACHVAHAVLVVVDEAKVIAERLAVFATHAVGAEDQALSREITG